MTDRPLAQASGYERLTTTGCSEHPCLRRRLREWAEAVQGPRCCGSACSPTTV